MNRKILTIFIVIGILCCSGGLVWADNNTTEIMEEIDLSHYITVSSTSGNKVTFSDGFAGFLIDGEKNHASSNDGFTSESTSDINIGNYLKLAIVECYKQGMENNIGSVIDKFVDGSYKSSNDKIVTSVLASGDSINDHEVVKISNDTGATFDFEVLKPVNDSTSRYIAYKVSLKTVEVEDNTSDDKLQASEDNQTEDNNTDGTDPTENNQKNTDEDKTTNNNKDTNEEKKDTSEEKDNSDKAAGDDNNTEVHVKNKTIVNKTNTVIVNEKNTTVINKTNVKHINNTTNDTANATAPQNNLMKVAGNPITILIIVVAIIAIAVAVYNRKG